MAGYLTFKSFVHRIRGFVQKNHRTIKNHIIGWCLFFFIDFFFVVVINDFVNIFKYFINATFITTSFYVLLFVTFLPNLPNRKIKAIKNGLMVLILLILIKFSVDLWMRLIPENFKENYYLKYFLLEIWRGSLSVIYAFAYWIYLQSLKEQKLRLLANLKLKETEEELLKTEIKFLKAQVNPHFLFNTLNFFYSETYRLSPRLGEGILGLTEILRYTVQSTQNEEIYVEKEATFLRKYIDIQQLRFHNKIQVDLKIDILAPQVMIPPLIILTFVENAFKYGKINDSENPLVIRLASDFQKITFYCKNTISTQFREPSTSVGIDNIKFRLDRHCKNYHLDVSNDDKFYIVKLQINFA